MRVGLEYGLRGVSDGSVREEEEFGAYGWTLSTDNGERAASGMGPVGGSKQQPYYRSEAMAMLSVLCFLHRLAEFTGKHDQWHGIIATDSQSLLDSLAKWTPQVKLSIPNLDPQRYFPSPYNTTVLMLEWDILIEIHHLLRAMPLLTLEYVKGHQDRVQPYQQLTLLAQLNVDADSMARKYQRQYGSKRPLSNLFPHTGVHLD